MGIRDLFALELCARPKIAIQVFTIPNHQTYRP
jgi:hypothetical protein